MPSKALLTFVFLAAPILARADVRIMPTHDIIVLIVMNAGNEAANQAIQDVGKPLRDRLKPFE